MVKGRVLVIAGSDSSGGAGLEADQKVIAAHGCYAMTATTALTAQNTTGVFDVHQIPTQFLTKQIDACFDDIGVDVVKTGMLASAGTIATVAESLKKHKPAQIVVDPVMVATSGAKLLPPDAIGTLKEQLLPLVTLLTPNVPEAQLLVKDAGFEPSPVTSVLHLESLAKQLHDLGPEWVLVKGGHTPFDQDYKIAHSEDDRHIVVDVLYGHERMYRIETKYISSKHTHGTGCSLASAIASNLAQGIDMPAAVQSACHYIEAAIKSAPEFGKGNGPLNHFHSVYRLPFAPNRFVDYLLSRPEVAPVWHEFVHHPFVMAMGNGTLPIESFKGYLVQDYLYLVHFARATALAAYKSKDMSDIAASASIVLHIQKEMNLHLTYCEGFGIPRTAIEQTEELMACTAYTRYVLDVGQSEDWLGLQVALAPCLLGYGAVAKMLHGNTKSLREGNTYWTWIENYVADGYVQAVITGSALLEKHALQSSPSRIEELVKIFIHATKMEIAFWEMFPSS